jgi:hypothetical protein
MRKIVIVAGLLAGAAFLFTTGTPAKAWVGCECVKLGAPAVCMRGPIECSASGGVCLAPCDYVAPKKVFKHHKKKKAMKKEIKKEDKKMKKEEKK